MHKTTRIAAALLVGSLILVGIKVGLALTHRPSDETQIHQALRDALEASRKGKPGVVMDLLSQQLKFNSQSVSDQSAISKLIRESHPDVSVENQRVLVTGDEARMVSPVDFKASFLGQSMSQHIDNVTLVFHREEARDYLFIPTTQWKLIEVRLPENQVPNVPE